MITTQSKQPYPYTIWLTLARDPERLMPWFSKSINQTNETWTWSKVKRITKGIRANLII